MPQVEPNAYFMGLGGITDWATQHPFLDIFKTSRPFIGHEDPFGWGGMEHEDLLSAGILDENGWPLEIPDGLDRIGTVFLTNLPSEATNFAGRYRVRFEGDGEINLRFAAEDVMMDENGDLWFSFTPSPDTLVGLDIIRSNPDDPVRNISVVHEDHVALYDSGEIFNPTFLESLSLVDGVRFMDWMHTNNSSLSEWSDRPEMSDAQWSVNGAPLEVMVSLANTLGVHPWFTIPHLATPEFIENFATIVRDTLDPNLVPHFEYSNEVWNWQFDQAQWAHAEGQARWGDDVGDAWVQFYGMKSAEMARIINGVFEGSDVHHQNVISVQTGWIGLEESILFAPRWVAEDPENNLPPHMYFHQYAVTGYFDGGLGRDEAPTVLSWLDTSLSMAQEEATNLGLVGAEFDAYVAAHRFDHATSLATQQLRDGSVTGNTSGSLVDLRSQWNHHAAVAETVGLRLVMYEGGTHVVGVGGNVWNEDLTEFFTHLNFTEEMGGLYTDLLTSWFEVTDGPFNAFLDTEVSGMWGSWGHRRWHGDENPRIESLESFFVALRGGEEGDDEGGDEPTDEDDDDSDEGDDDTSGGGDDDTSGGGDDDTSGEDTGDEETPPEGGEEPETPPEESGGEEEAAADEGSCFMASVAYGDATHPDVAFLRQVRDTRLMGTAWGRDVVALYWRWGPRLAAHVRGRSWAVQAVRGVLSSVIVPCVRRVTGSSRRV